MENTEFASAVRTDDMTDFCPPEDRKLLERYSAHMVAEALSWRERTVMLSAVTQFLQWWRRLYVGAAYDIHATCGSRPHDEAAWPYLRESYLRFACEDRSLRHDERSVLNHFFRFLAAHPSVVRSTNQ
jgi:hypothetical protein